MWDGIAGSPTHQAWSDRVRELNKMRKNDLATLWEQRMREQRMTMLLGGPQVKEDYINAILELEQA